MVPLLFRPPPLDAARTSGKTIVVLSPKGGSGKTMVATNLAIALASTNTGATALVDLDAVFGDVATALSIVPAHTVEQLATSPNFDGTLEEPKTLPARLPHVLLNGTEKFIGTVGLDTDHVAVQLTRKLPLEEPTYVKSDGRKVS